MQGHSLIIQKHELIILKGYKKISIFRVKG